MSLQSISENQKVCRSAMIYSRENGKYQYTVDGLLVVQEDEQGRARIAEVGEAAPLAQKFGLRLEEIPKSAGLVLPGLFDMHFHWVQDDVRTMPKESLLEWLEKYTFPTEAKFADAAYAEQRAEAFWKKMYAFGTIGGLCYSSLHDVALDAAMRHAPPHFLIGNALMTMNSPAYLQTTSEQAIASAARAFQKYGRRYVGTPRFAPTTDAHTMRATTTLAKEQGCFEQTHMGETLAEIAWVVGMYQQMEGFADVQTYTDIYNRCGVLGEKTVLGHCIHLRESEWARLAETKTKIASCPTSNAPLEDYGLGSGLFDYQQADRYGVAWALASDIGGGPHLSMFDVMHSFVQQNHAAGNKDATYELALEKSSRAGAQILGLKKGDLAVGYDADYITIAADEEQLRAASSPEEILRSILTAPRPREDFANLVIEVIIKGEKVV